MDWVFDAVDAFIRSVVEWLASILPLPWPVTDQIIGAVQPAVGGIISFIVLSQYFGNLYLFLLCVGILWSIRLILLLPRAWAWLMKLKPW